MANNIDPYKDGMIDGVIGHDIMDLLNNRGKKLSEFIDFVGGVDHVIRKFRHNIISQDWNSVARDTYANKAEALPPKQTYYQLRGKGFHEATTALTVYDPEFARQQLMPHGVMSSDEAWRRAGFERGWTQNMGGMTEHVLTPFRTSNQTYDEAPAGVSMGALVTPEMAQAFAKIRAMKSRGSTAFANYRMPTWQKQFYRQAEEFGSGSAGRVRAQIAMDERFREAMDAITMSPKELRLRELQDQYGDTFGRKLFDAERTKAAETASSSHRRKLAKRDAERATAEREQRAKGTEAYYTYMMGDEDRERLDFYRMFRGSKNIHQKVNDAMDKKKRDEYLKGLPSFFKDSKISTKNLGKIHDLFKRIPGGNYLAKVGPAGWALMGAALINRMAAKSTSDELEGDKKTVAVNFAKRLYGGNKAARAEYRPMIESALKGGMSTEAAWKKIGRRNAEWGGNAKLGYGIFNEVTKGMPAWQKLLVADEFGFDEDDMKIAANLGKKGSEEERGVAAGEIFKTERAKRRSSKGGMWRSWFRRVGDWLTYDTPLAGGILTDSRVHGIMQEQAEAAEAYKRESGGIASGTGGTTYGSNTFNIGTANFNGSSVRSMVKDVADRSDMSEEEKKAVMDSFDGGE